ncbi:MAG: hypothetical protein ACI9VR_001482 [Cognaticolwellia sp.]|jgi:hypothetical protein
MIWILLLSCQQAAQRDAGQAPSTLKLSDLETELQASDSSVGDAFGGSLVCADIDADGYQELVVGAGDVDQLYVYPGSASGLDTASEEILSSSLGSFGGPLASGDVNGDGYPDLAVQDGSNTATVSILHGSASGLNSTSEYSISASDGAALDAFGAALSMAGDLNGDGYADLIVGATRADAPLAESGALYIYLGSSTGLSASSEQKLVPSDSVGTHYFGTDAIIVADQDGDGLDEVAVGAPGDNSFTGAVYLYFGSSTGVSAATESKITVSGTYHFGSTLSAADVDGDGYSDLLVGSPRGPVSGSGSGRVYTFYGAATGLDTLSPDSLGEASYQSDFGAKVRGLGDFDGDGYDDAVVQELARYGGGTSTVFYGSASGLDFSTQAQVGGGGWYAGDAACAGDWDADGWPDLAVGVWNQGSFGSFTSSAGLVKTYAGAERTWYADADADGFGDASSSVTQATAPTGYVSDDTDCDDTLAAVNPDARELAADGLDNDCDGWEYCWEDWDQDGYVAQDAKVQSLDMDCTDAGEGDSSTPTGECDDFDASIHPGAAELAGDGVDQDCDGYELCYADVDGDGASDGSTLLSLDLTCTSTGQALSGAPHDCDDGDSTVYTGATEIPGDGVDQDCDGLEHCYFDLDADGDPSTSASVGNDGDCMDTGESSSAGGDCADDDASVHSAATEIPGDGFDQDCDGVEHCYPDLDGDGVRTSSAAAGSTLDCSATGEATSALPSGDCDDADADTYPGATEVVGDEVDQDCDGLEVCYVDADGDGDRSTATVSSADVDCSDSGEAAASADVDCDDTDTSISSSATEVPGDEVDQDCDGQEICYTDADSDGYGTSTLRDSVDTDCSDSGEAASDGGDCDDSSASVYPGATEIVADGLDQDCDGVDTCHGDSDGDGYTSGTVTGTDLSCAGLGEASALTATDCQDSDAAINPGATELTGDGVDQNCDGLETCYRDNDNDGARGPETLGTPDLACSQPLLASAAADEDCDDADSTIFPGATEGLGDGIDQDCDDQELCWQDLDQDGAHADLSALSATLDCSDGSSAGSSAVAGDCDDSDAHRSPLLAEVPGDGVDQDCDLEELCYVDQDLDGYRSELTQNDADWTCAGVGLVSATEPGGDCDDTDPLFNPGADESDCSDPSDYNCDGSVAYEDADLDGHAACEDCRDDDPWINPDASEVCDGQDNDCDGVADNDDALDAPLWFQDDDADGYGQGDVSTRACFEPAGNAADGGDCEDGDPEIFPGAPDPCGDGVDQNCDGRGGPLSDEDKDGLTWLEEQELGTQACEPDSDGDGRLDGEDRLPGCGGCGGDRAPSGGAIVVLVLLGLALRGRRGACTHPERRRPKTASSTAPGPMETLPQTR